METLEGHMYQVIEGQIVEVTRQGNEVLPVTTEVIGQLILELEYPCE